MLKPLARTVLALIFTAAPTPGFAADSDLQQCPADIIVERMVAYHYNRADRNEDDVLSKAEIQAYASQMFQDADLDGNNVLTREELLTVKEQEYQTMLELETEQR